MRKYFLILLFITSIGNSIDVLSWIPGDKRHHIGGSYIITDIFRNKLNMTWRDTFFAMLGVTIAKGFLDEVTGGKMDVKDGAANMIGFGLNFIVNFD